MGLFDSVVGALGQAAAGGAGGAGQPDLMKVVMSLVQQAGGLEGLMAKLQQGGLGEAAASWVSTGRNLPVSGDQLQGALGGLLGPLAGQLGMQPGALSDSLATLLPGMIDGLTPNGQLPAGGAMPDLSGLLGSLLQR
jgi:uncharacterized protein YidB (DUF937 family)